MTDHKQAFRESMGRKDSNLRIIHAYLRHLCEAYVLHVIYIE